MCFQLYPLPVPRINSSPPENINNPGLLIKRNHWHLSRDIKITIFRDFNQTQEKTNFHG